MTATPSTAQAFAHIAQSIGNTPLIALNHLSKGLPAKVWVKLESRNPAGSVKDRIANALVTDAQARGVLGEGREIVEPTSGNTGIALAMVAASKGIPITLVMPDTMSIERRKLVLAYGAKLVLTEGAKGMPGAIAKAQAIHDSDPSRYVLLQQFSNPANPAIHEATTGPEIWTATQGQVDIFVAGVGTGGTLTGTTRYLRQHNPALQVVAVEPEASPVISQYLAGQPLQPAPHKIQGIGAGFIPDVLDTSLINAVETVSNELAVETALQLAKAEGILAGISGGAALAAALRVAARPEHAGKQVVVVLPDAGERYLSSILFNDLFDEQGNPLNV